MADQKQKVIALNHAIEITKNYARGGYTAHPDLLIENAYRKIVELIDDANNTGD